MFLRAHLYGRSRRHEFRNASCLGPGTQDLPSRSRQDQLSVVPVGIDRRLYHRRCGVDLGTRLVSRTGSHSALVSK